MSDKKKVIKIKSPVGTINWFKLVTPDKKYHKYSVDLVVEDTPELRKLMSQMEDEAKAKMEEEQAKARDKKDHKRLKNLSMSKSMPIEEQVDAQGNPTGKFVMKFKLASSGKRKDDSVYQIAPPVIFNAQGKPYSAEEKKALRVFNGSIGQVAGEISAYALATGAVGVTLKPKACIIKKIQQADADISQFGFEADEFSSEDESLMMEDSEDQGEKVVNGDF